MKLERPQPSRDGWFPEISPDGRFLACGNARVYVCDLHTLEIAPISDPMGTTHAARMGWLDNRFLGIINHAQQGNKDVWLYDVQTGKLEPRKDIADPAFLTAVNFFQMREGHWGASRPPTLTFDNKVLSYKGGPTNSHSVSVNGPWLVTMNAGNNYSLVRYYCGEFHSELIPPIANNFFTINERGDVLYGFGQQHIWYVDGRDEDATTTPWRSETVGVTTYAGDDLWIWHGVENGGRSIVVGRPIYDDSDDGVIVIEAANAFTAPHEPNLSVVWNQEAREFTVATCDALGNLFVATHVSVNEPRQTLELQIPKVSKNFLIGTFQKYSDRDGDVGDLPENVTVVSEAGAVARAAAQVPVIITRECLDAAVPFKDRVVALFIGDTGGAQNAEVKAREFKNAWKTKTGKDTPVLWYITPNEVGSGAALPPSVDVLGPQFYFDDWHGLEEQRWRMLGNWKDKIGTSKPWIPIYQAYDRNGAWDTNAMQQLYPILPAFFSQLVTSDRRTGDPPPAIGLLFFSASRKGGMRTFPKLKRIYKSIFAAIPGPAAWPKADQGGVVVNTNPPKITITSYDPRSGPASDKSPLRVKAVYRAEEGAGPIDTLEWMFKTKDGNWTIAATNDPSDPDHTYQFNKPGFYEIRLRATGPGGTWETQAQRVVQATSPTPAPQPVPEPAPNPVPVPTPVPTPPPAPKPATGLVASLRSLSSGLFLNVDKNGLAVMGTEPKDFEFIVLGPGKVAVKGPNGKFGAAEGGGGGKLRFRSDAVAGGWEQFNIILNANIIGFQAADSGKFVSARNEGKGPVEVTADALDSWETFLPSPSLSFHSQKIAGRIRVQDRLFVNDDGIFRPNFTSELALCMHNDDEIMARLDDDVRTGFNGIRVFCGALSWKGQTADHARARLPFIIEQARDRGLYVQPVALTDTKDGQRFDKREHTRLIGEICGRYENTILEIANEYWHPSQDDETHDLNYLARLRREVVPGHVMTALGAPEEDEVDPNQYAALGQADIIVFHMNRSRDKWNMVRRVRELEAGSANFRKAVINNEPIGAADNPIGGKRENDPAIYFTFGILNRLFEVGGCFHSDAGLQGDPRSPQQQACAEAWVKGMELIQSKARLRFQNMNNTGAWPQSPIKNVTNVVRAYSGLAEDGSANLVVFVGVSGEPGVEMQNGWRLGEELARMNGVRVVRLVR